MKNEVGLFQRLTPYLLLAVIFWVTIGRAFLGSGGWMILIMLFTFLPLALGYAIAFFVVLLVRQRKVGYRFNLATTISIATMLIAGFLFGLTIVDGGDTKESIDSVITQMAAAPYGSPLFDVSNTLSYIFGLIGVVAAIVSFVLICLKGKKA